MSVFAVNKQKGDAWKNALPSLRFLRLFLDNFLAVVVAALAAYSVVKVVCAAFRALRHSGKLELPYV